MELLNMEEKHKKLCMFLMLCREKITEPCESEMKGVLTPLQFYGLCAVHYYHEMTMTDLASVMNMSKQNTTKLADHLVEAQLIERKLDVKDRRIVRISMTQKGDAYLNSSFILHTQRLVAKIEKLPKEDQEDFYSSLDCLNRIFQKMPAQKGEDRKK